MLLSADLLENEVFLNPTQQLYKKWSFLFFFIDFDYKLPLTTLRIPLSPFLRTYFLEHIQLLLIYRNKIYEKLVVEVIFSKIAG